MRAKNIMPAVTGASQSGEISLDKQEASVFASGTLAGAETIDLQVKDETGSWQDVSDLDGNTTQLTATVNAFSIKSPGVYRLDKGATNSAAGAFIYASRI